MKKLLCLVMSIIMLSSLVAGCAPKTADEIKEAKETTSSAKDVEEKEEEVDLPVIRVAVMPYYLSAPIGYMIDNKLDEAAGFKIEPVMFASGGPINEALPSDEFDISPTGGAWLFGVANYGAYAVGSHIAATGGNSLWVRKDSDIAKVMGFNPDFPDILGDPESLQGVKILQTSGTTGQLMTEKWLEALGVPTSDVEPIHMDFAQVYQAFKTGEGDVAALVQPYSSQTQDDWVKVADLYQLKTPLYETIIMPKEKYEDPEMFALGAKFLRAMYETYDILEADYDEKISAVSKWYKDNGNETEEDIVKAECEAKPLVTTDIARDLVIGAYELDMAQFFVSVGKLEPEKLEGMAEKMGQDILDAAFAE